MAMMKATDTKNITREREREKYSLQHAPFLWDASLVSIYSIEDSIFATQANQTG